MAKHLLLNHLLPRPERVWASSARAKAARATGSVVPPKVIRNQNDGYAVASSARCLSVQTAEGHRRGTNAELLSKVSFANRQGRLVPTAGPRERHTTTI